MKTLKLAFLSSTVLEFFTSVAIASLAIYIGFSLYGAISWGPAAELSLFTGLAILILAPEFFQPLRNLSQYYHDRAAAVGAADNLVALFKVAHPPRTENSEIKDTKNTHGAASHNRQLKTFTLNIERLCIAYVEHDTANRPINLSLKTGDILVVSGPSGSGKTTFLNTLAGYLPASEGHFTVLPIPHQPMAYLPQKPWIKNHTIYQNLIALAPQASREDMVRVLQDLGLAKELLHTRKGLDLPIGEHGQGLSGGQMQRIALARVMLNPTAVVLLDEPTAKLDVLSKQYIIKALMLLKEKAILVVVTHDTALFGLASHHLHLDALAGAQ